MPNWCNNEIQVTGDEEKLKEFKEFVRNSEGYHDLCANKFKWVTDPETGKRDTVEVPNPCKQGDPFKDDCDKKYN